MFVLGSFVLTVRAAPSQRQTTATQTVVGTDNVFHDEENGVAVQLPAGWTISGLIRWGDRQTTLSFSGPRLWGANARLNYKIFHSPLDIQPGEVDSWLRKAALKTAEIRTKQEQNRLDQAQSGEGGYASYMVRPDSFISRNIGGRPALSWKADYTNPSGQKCAEYLTYVFSEDGTALFYLDARWDEINSAIPQFEKMIATIKIP